MNHVLLLLTLMVTAHSWTRFKRLKCLQVLPTIQCLISRKLWRLILIIKLTKLFCKRSKYFLIYFRTTKSTNNLNSLLSWCMKQQHSTQDSVQKIITISLGDSTRHIQKLWELSIFKDKRFQLKEILNWMRRILKVIMKKSLESIHKM